jgi:uncharacterized cupin superfamily protein
MDNIIIASKSSITPSHQNEHAPYEYFKYNVATADMGNQCTVAFFELPPGKSNYPYHYHTASEEIFYIISGTGLFRTPEGERTVSSGDVIVFPPNKKGAHKLSNPSDTETLCYLDVDTNRIPEVVFYPDSDKLGVKTGGEMKNLFMYDTDVDYYAGE